MVSTRRRVPTNWVSGRTLLPSIESVVATSYVPSKFLVDGQVSGLGTVHSLLTLNFLITCILPLHVVSSTLKRKSSSSEMDGLQRRRMRLLPHHCYTTTTTPLPHHYYTITTTPPLQQHYYTTSTPPLLHHYTTTPPLLHPHYYTTTTTPLPHHYYNNTMQLHHHYNATTTPLLQHHHSCFVKNFILLGRRLLTVIKLGICFFPLSIQK